MLLLFLACALPQFNNWIPFTVVIFYLISPIPTLIVQRRGEGSSRTSPGRELACFLTTGIVVSAFALPIVLARAPLAQAQAPIPSNGTSTTTPAATTTPNLSEQFATVIDAGACGLVIAANSVMFFTILGFFLTFDSDDVEYSVW